jgi:hypothetical protein
MFLFPEGHGLNEKPRPLIRTTTPEFGSKRTPHLCSTVPNVQRHMAYFALAKPGVECSPDLPRGLRRVSESAPISRRRVGRHRRRCSRPTRGGDSIYDKSLTGEPILPARTRTNICPDIGSRFAPVKLVHRSEIYHKV